MASSTSSLVSLGYSPPFATVSDDDHTAWILIATTLGIIYSLVFAGFRAFVVYTTRRKFGPEDATLGIATVIAVVQSIINLSACSLGLGKSNRLISGENLDIIQGRFYIAKLMFIVALGWSKISVFLLLKQISPHSRHRKIFMAIVGSIAVWTVASLLALALQCDLSRPWIVYGASCENIYMRWQIISAFDILFEVIAVASIIFITIGLQTSWSNKATVIGAFALRLVMIVPITFRLRTFQEKGLHTDPTLAQSLFIIWTQVEIYLSLILATLPCLRPVINKLVTHYGALGPAESSAYGYGSDGRRNESYQLSSLKQSVKSAERPVDTHSGDTPITGKAGAYTYDIETTKGNTPATDNRASRRVNSVGSAESRELIIQKHVSWTIERESIDPKQ